MKLFMIISGILLILGIANMPEWYGLFIRIIILIASIAVIINEIKSGFNFWILLFAGIAILFNPFIFIDFEDFLTKALIYMAGGFIFIVKASIPNKHLHL